MEKLQNCQCWANQFHNYYRVQIKLDRMTQICNHNYQK